MSPLLESAVRRFLELTSLRKSPLGIDAKRLLDQLEGLDSTSSAAFLESALIWSSFRKEGGSRASE